MKKTLALLSIVALLNFFTPSFVFATSAPTIEASGQSSLTSPVGRISSPITLTYNFAPVGANNMLFVTWGDCANDSSITSATATWNGGAMTRVTGSNGRTAGFYIVGATTGSHDVVVSWDVTTARAVVGANTITGVNQTTPIDTGSTVTAGGATTLSVSGTTAVANDLLIDYYGADGNTDTRLSADSPQTAIYNTASGSGDSNGVYCGSSWKTVAGTGSQTMSWTKTAGTNLASGYSGFAAIEPAASAAFDFGKLFQF